MRNNASHGDSEHGVPGWEGCIQVVVTPKISVAVALARALAYGAAASVMAGRLLGRDHWSSDVFVGSALGYFIGAHIFHSHCNPKFGGACHSH